LLTLLQYTIPEQKVWGAAYRIEKSKAKEVQEYLDIREVNGYSIQHTTFSPASTDQKPFTCLVYIGMPDNPQFMGVQEPQALAEHICHSKGPSGENKEYLLALEQALNSLSADSADAHIADLADRVRKCEAKTKDAKAVSTMQDAVVKAELSKERMQSTDEQEEVEQTS